MAEINSFYSQNTPGFKIEFQLLCSKMKQVTSVRREEGRTRFFNRLNEE